MLRNWATPEKKQTGGRWVVGVVGEVEDMKFPGY